VDGFHAAQQGNIDGDAVDVPLRHHDDEAKPKDIQMMLAEPGFVGHRMLGAACSCVFNRLIARVVPLLLTPHRVPYLTLRHLRGAHFLHHVVGSTFDLVIDAPDVFAHDPYRH
jgi:hypothetical protein